MVSVRPMIATTIMISMSVKPADFGGRVFTER